MQQKISIRLLPSEAAADESLKEKFSAAAGVSPQSLWGYTILKRSLDARGRQAWVNLTALLYIDEPFDAPSHSILQLKDVTQAEKRCIIIGAGPAGLFAALSLIEKGIKPIILERGKDVRSRRRDLAAMNKEGIVNPESNYCFGEGGAGTYSDGKLYTRSNKRGSISRILNILVQFGATEKILYESHPHIGTNKLPQIIVSIREAIRGNGGEVHFEEKLTGFKRNGNKITEVLTASGNRFSGDAVILATGHSARDIFELLWKENILIEAKPFALGVRVEHPQELIDSIQYHQPLRDPHLPPAAYSLVQQVEEGGVFSFCMCPGGIIAPAATAPGEIVVNGWSPSKRNNPYANSGIVVSVEEKHLQKFKKEGPLASLAFQRSVERKAFEAGGGALVAPAQRMVDFCNNSFSSSLPDCSYLPGLNSVLLRETLPPFIYTALQKGFREFGKKMKGYFTNEAVVVATESRTSSPVRIPRDETGAHPQVENLFPCGEGAGYAGGIVSAAMDGERMAEAALAKIHTG